jgi:hypothetical protein
VPCSLARDALAGTSFVGAGERKRTCTDPVTSGLARPALRQRCRTLMRRSVRDMLRACAQTRGGSCTSQALVFAALTSLDLLGSGRRRDARRLSRRYVLERRGLSGDPRRLSSGRQRPRSFDVRGLVLATWLAAGACVGCGDESNGPGMSGTITVRTSPLRKQAPRKKGLHREAGLGPAINSNPAPAAGASRQGASAASAWISLAVRASS